MHQYQFFKDNPTKKLIVLEYINYNMAEKEKFTASDSIKRAAVTWGVGAFLYELGMITVGAKEYKTVYEDVERVVEQVAHPLIQRKKILFACRENACRSQMAAAFAQFHTGDMVEAECAGSTPVSEINPAMMKVMQEKGIDMAFRKPKSIHDAISENKPEIIITMGCGEECPSISGVKMIDWDLPDPAVKSTDFMRKTRDEIEARVLSLTDETV